MSQERKNWQEEREGREGRRRGRREGKKKTDRET